MSEKTPRDDQRPPSLIEEARKRRSSSRDSAGADRSAPRKKASKSTPKKTTPGRVFSDKDVAEAKKSKVILDSRKRAAKKSGVPQGKRVGLGGDTKPAALSRDGQKPTVRGAAAKKAAGAAANAVPGGRVAKKAVSAAKRAAPGAGAIPGASGLLGQARAKQGGKTGLHGPTSGQRKSSPLERQEGGTPGGLGGALGAGGLPGFVMGGMAMGARKKSGRASSLGIAAIEGFRNNGDTKVEGSQPKKKRGLLAFAVVAVVMFMTAIMMAGVIGGGMAQQQQSLISQGAVVAIEEGASGDDEGDVAQEGPQQEEVSRGRDTGSTRVTDSSERLYPPDGGGDSGVLDLSERQLEAFSIALEAARDEGLSEKSQKDVILAVWVESKGWNLANDGSGSQGALKADQDPEEIRSSMDHPESDGLPSDHGYGHGGDHGSVGILQQQVPWWGTVDELMDRYTATLKFIEKYKEKGVADLPPGRAIQTVQASAFADGDNYQSNLPTAEAIYEAIK